METRRIADLSSAELLEFVRGADLEEPDVLDVLRNPYCTVEVAEAVADTRRWLASHVVRERVAGFRGLPFARAMDLLATLPWTSLLQIAQQPKTPPVVRRQAEKKLLARIVKMALGEKVALARRSHRPLYPSLVSCGDVHILKALLDNPRLTENDVLLILNTTEVLPEVARAIAGHRRWGHYYRVKVALARCPRTPLPVALSVLVQLRRVDVEGLADDPRAPPGLRVAARQLMAKGQEDERGVLRSRR